MQIIELDEILATGRLLVALRPTDGNRRIIKMVNFVVGHEVRAALQNHNAGSRRINQSGMVLWLSVFVGDFLETCPEKAHVVLAEDALAADGLMLNNSTPAATEPSNDSSIASQ
jgi:hypothetical protein